MGRTVFRNRFVSCFFAFALIFSVLGSVVQPATAQTEEGGSTNDALRAYYCDLGNPDRVGSVADWWEAELAAGNMPSGYVNCWSLTIDTSVCGQVSATMISWIDRYGDFGKRDQLRYNEAQWYDGTTWSQWPIHYSPTEDYQGSPVYFFKEFPEDYNGGYVDVRFGIRVAERDTVRGMSTYIFDHSSQGSYGPYYRVNTDCEAPLVYLGCSQGYFKNNGYGAETTLAAAGLTTPYNGDTTLLEVLSNPGSGKVQRGVQTYDGYTRQQVTAYLNKLQFGADYPLSLADIQAGKISMADLEYYNHGGEDVLCP